MNIRNCVTLCLLSFLLLACGSNKDKDLHDYIKDVAKRPGRHVPPIPDVKPTANYKYPSHLKRRDPFSSIRKRPVADITAPDLTRKKQVLETFPLDGLKYVGILSQGEEHWALIQAPNGEVYKVTVGQYIGTNYGRVVKITPKLIMLIETIRANGRWQKKTVKLKLR